MHALLRDRDWSATPLGPLDEWPQSLKTTADIVLNSPVAMVVMWGVEGVLIYNDAYAAFAGDKHPKAFGMGAREAWPEIADHNDRLIHQVMGGERVSLRDQELVLDRRGTLEPAWMDLDYSPIHDEAGRPAGVLVVVVETTERVVADREGEAARERLDMALSAGQGVGTWDWDIVNDRVYADARFAQLYGVDPETARQGAPLSEFFNGIHPEDAPRIQAEIARTLETRRPFKEEYRLVRPDGSEVWVAAEGRPTYAEDGTPQRFPGVTFDITERRTISDALEDSEARYHALFDNIDVGFCIVRMIFDADGRPADYVFLETNPAFEAQSGLYGAVGKRMKALSPTHEAVWFETYGQVALTGETIHFESGAEGLGKWWDVHAYRIGPAEDRIVAILFTDITERKLSELRQAALLTFNERIAEAGSVAEAGLVAAEILAERLGGDRAGYGTVDLEGEGVSYEREWTRDDGPAPPRTANLRTFGSFVDDLKRGEIVLAPDIAHDPRTQGDPDAYAARGVKGFAVIPVMAGGTLEAMLTVASGEVRDWSDADLSFLAEVAERTRITIDRMRVEESARDSDRRYRTLFETMDEGFCVIEFIDGPTGKALDDYVHVEANPAYAENAGIPDIVGKRLREIVGDEGDEWVRLYRGVLESGEPIRFEKELEATGRWLELAAFRVEPRERNQVAVLFKDLTARKQTEVALQASEAQLARVNAMLGQRLEETLVERKLLGDVVESVDAFVQVIDHDLRWLAVNRAASDEYERVFGRRPQTGETLPQTLAHLPEEVARFERIWRQALAGESVHEIMEVGDPAIARNPHEIRLYPLRDAGGKIIGAFKFGYDISDRLAEQQRLREAEEALRQSQKMEAVGQLTGGIAHDFNNLLAGISGSLELLGKRLAEGRTTGLERYITAAQGASQRAASLTQRLLAFSRRQTLDPRPTEVNRLIHGMEDLIRRTVGPDVEVEVVGAAGLWPTRIDQSQLENALLNLCINARDAMTPGGGRLTIETANKWLDDRASRERELPPGQYVSLCVTDTGTGMSPETIEKIFEPFFTTKPLGQGTGLGLSMIHGFVRQSGGQVRVYSEPGDGTTMCLYLPRYVGPMETQDARSTGYEPVHGHGETILVIDDEPTVRMLVAEVLHEAGYDVIEAEDGPSGLRVLETDRRIDLLVTDVGLPGGMNGRQVADAARVRRPELKVLFITGYAENAAVGNGLLEPGMEVLTKPFVMTELSAKVVEMVEGPPGIA